MEPEVWRWIWLATAATFIVGEIAMTGAFFLLPFGVGAAAATAVAFTGANATWQWLAFVIASAVAFAALRPLSRRMASESNPVGVGAGVEVGRVSKEPAPWSDPPTNPNNQDHQLEEHRQWPPRLS